MNERPRILIAIDKFKGCLSGRAVAASLRAGILSENPDAQVVLHPVADGGDGFSDELTHHGFCRHVAETVDALGRTIESSFVERAGTVVIEMALASGLQQIEAEDRRPLVADTYGLGLLMRAATEHQPSTMIVGAGGSATSDGGAGALAALGAVVRGGDGSALSSYGPIALRQARGVDVRPLAQWDGVAVYVATDVTNPLLGAEGAAKVFGPQKGATNDDIVKIEQGLERWADILERARGRELRNAPGAGAAGGLGFGLGLGLGAQRLDGLDTFARLSNLNSAIEGADLVITGEGSFDAQTTSGKAPLGVLRHAQRIGRPCWVVAGRSDISDAALRSLGFAGQRTLMQLAPDEESSMREAARWLVRTGAELMRVALPIAR